MSMVDFDASPFPYYQLRPHRVVIPCLVVLIGVEIWMVASLDPHVEPGIVPPTAAHQILSCQVLLCFSFVHVKHEEEQFFRHFRDD